MLVKIDALWSWKYEIRRNVGRRNHWKRPPTTTDCCSLISSCKVSAQVQLQTLHKCYQKQNQNQPSQRASMMGSSKVVARLVATSHEGREISEITRTSMNFVMNQNWTSCSWSGVAWSPDSVTQECSWPPNERECVSLWAIVWHLRSQIRQSKTISINTIQKWPRKLK